MAAKASALRSVTVDIYDNARNQDIIDANVCARIPSRNRPWHGLEWLIYGLQTETFNNFGSSLSNSATRLTRMAASGNKIAVFKLAGIIIATFIVLWWIKKLVFG